MSSYYTSNKLIDSVVRRASIPENQATFSDTDFLEFANEEIKIGLVPLIMSMNEEYFVYPEEVAIAANTSVYQIPYRAIGSKLRDLFYEGTNGDLREMVRIAPEDKALFQSGTSATSSDFLYYYVQGNDVVLVPEVSSSPVGNLIFTYYLRPNELVAEERAAEITAISVGDTTTTFTVDGIPTNMSASVQVDIIQQKPGHKTRAFDIYPTSVSSAVKQIVFSNDDLPTNIVVGDYICFSGETIVPQIPTDLHVILAQRVAQRCLESMGDVQGLQSATSKLQEMETKTVPLIDNRVEGSPRKVVNRKGLLRSSKISRRW